MKQRHIWLGWLSLVIVALLSSCAADEVPHELRPKHRALGKLNEIVVISDENLWEGAVGDTFRYYFESAFPIMPRPEPMFNVRHFTSEQIQAEPLRRQLRTYVILADLSETTSPTTQMVSRDLTAQRVVRAQEDSTFTTSIGQNKWANGQIVIYVFAPTVDGLMKSIRRHYPSIAKRVNQHDIPPLEAATYAQGVNRGLGQMILDEIGLTVKIPAGFRVAAENKNDHLYWFRKETRDASLNLVFQKIRYTSQAQFSADYVKQLRDAFGKHYVSSTFEGSYMRTNDEDLPMFEYTHEIDGMYTKEFRGIWEMANDFMGGPFMTHLIWDADNEALYFCDAFIYAPGINKRDIVQQLDLIVKGAKKSSG